MAVRDLSDEPIVGRDEELRRVVERVAFRADGQSAVVIEGRAGIGKTTLWREAVRIADEAGSIVLSCRPTSRETPLSFAGLADLVEPALDSLRPHLPDPQRRALEIALLLSDPRGPPPDERAIGAALTTALRTLAATAPVLVAVDDMQWLDASTAAALRFAIRRVVEEGSLRLLLTRRLGSEDRSTSDLDRALTSAGAERIHLEGLTVGSLSRLLATRLDVVLPRPTLLRIHEISAGNPFYAIEVARAVVARGELRPTPGPLPIPATLDELLRERVEGLPDEVRHSLLVVACAGRPTFAVLERALAGDQEAVLRPALDAGVAETDGISVSLSHPLLAAWVYTHATDRARRAAHAALAAAADGLEDRARHLALGVPGPDETVAAALEAAAEAALARGAPSSAVELAMRARDMTPDVLTEAVNRRALLAGEVTWVAGDYEQARAMLQTVVDAATAGPLRAGALLRLARSSRDMRESARLCEEAWLEAEGDERLRTDIDASTAIFLHAGGDVDEASRVAARGAEAAAAVGDRRREALPRSFHALMELVAGRGCDLETMRAAVAVEEETGTYPARIGPKFLLAQALGHTDAFEESRELLLALEAEAREDGDVRYGRILVTRALQEVRAGRLQVARELAEEARDLWQDVGQGQEEGKARATLAQAEAQLGLEAEARVDIDAARRLAHRASEYFAQIRAGYAEVLLELSLGNGAAAEAAERLLEVSRAGGFRSSLVVPAAPCAVEAFVSASRLGEAEALAREVEDEAARVNHPRLALYAERSRALVLAAHGDTTGAVLALERAARVGVGVKQPLERARTALLLGRMQLRAKQRRAARASLEQSVHEFEGLGATLWAGRAREELRKVGGRPARRNELTAAEERVATLAAEGKTNKEIGAALFVTPKTVEFHLRHVYDKLGVRSRTELARQLTAAFKD
jgi:DNA-binding NarL/FixJ family response regulator/ABC-type cobalamin/Fe3+-siderophores transport system ATPase subunit